MTDLPESLRRFIEFCIPTFEAAEILLLLAARTERGWNKDEILAEIRPSVVSVSAVQEYLAIFKLRGILTEKDGYFYFSPSSPELSEGVGALREAYNHRPVTLISTIYRLADRRIQSFADAFKLRKD